MECPVCGNELTQKEAGGITVDACEGRCGGIWFDRYELMRVDESHESAGESLLEIDRDPSLAVDREKRFECPRDGAIMMRHFFSAKRRVVADECPRCGGHWLDPGELATIRTEYASEADRKQAAREYFSDLFDAGLAAEHARTEEDLARARRFAHALRFLCPSYYLPGRQEWGAF